MSEDGCLLKQDSLSDIDSSSDHPSSSSPSSRPKTGCTASTFKPHDEFWLPDGNIILVANNTTAFRVYRGLIAAQSTVFEDMFAASMSNSDELLEECPVIHLSDSPGDVVYLLRVLLPKSRRLYHRTDKRTFNEVFAVIRLAHKYHIQDVEEQALASLQENTFSPRFADWYKPPRLTSFEDLDVAIGIVNIARLTNTPSLLPGALYICSHLGGKLVDGWAREDGTVEHLSTEDLRRCLKGHPVLAREVILLPGRVFVESRVKDCTTHGRCQLSRQRRLLRIISSQEMFVKRRALGIWRLAIEDMAAEEDTGPMKICGACEKALLKRDRQERWLLWRKLPEIFGITVEGWGSGGTEDEGEGAVDI